MESRLTLYRTALFVLILAAIGGLSFAAGLMWAGHAAHAADRPPQTRKETKIRVVYPKKTEIDLDATEIQGEMNNPGDFYFQRKPEEKFDSLVKRRPHFHREMLRDAVLSK